VENYVVNMPIEVRDATLDELQVRIHKFLLYDRILDSYVLVFVLSMLLPPLLGYFVARLIGMELLENWTGFLILLGIAFSFAMLPILQRKREEYNVESDEWTKFYSNLIYTNLENSFKTESSGWKKNYRKKALKNARDFLLCVDERFTVGQFKPVKQYVGNSISKFKQNLRYRVIPAIKDGDEGLLKNISQIMYNFLYSSKNLSIEYLNEVNKQMAERLPNREPLKARYSSKIWIYMQAHKAAKHSAFVLGFVAICSSLGYIAVTYFGIVKEYVWTGCIALFVGLLIVYFQRQPKPET
jgi:hypothetical protein